MTPRPRPGYLFDELRSLLAPVQELQRRHQQRLDAHRTEGGEVFEDQYAAYDDARLETAIEASDALDTLVAQLELLVADPPRRAFTLALRGPGADEGNLPWLFVVNGDDLDDAYQKLSQLPSFHLWLEDVRRPGTSRHGEEDLLADQSHPGVRGPGTYIDLRREQARVLARRAPARSPLVPPAPPPSAPGRAR
ncbi:hypothetical protein GCM10010211_20040 [Streptomyces albospinus]|uniref:Uncharacterized protein n=1 Tax=Streptomyces albospinus TaxID=285515 RepID=A0ABQ2UWD5_9ACTN|nr:hypothetical protein [Streptomyces albospinus]GGU55332.1 hypothetical protein GCM10010211_20040 [Streptomyces albospinus]